MPKRGKDNDENPSSGDSDGGAQLKKNAKRTFGGSSDSDGIIVCEIAKNRRVAVRSWQGKPTVDIREFYMKDGKQLPGKKGIMLTLEQWNILRENVEKINKAVTGNS